MSNAATHDIVIDQGATWTLALTWQDSTGAPVDMTGFDVRAQVRTSYADDDGDILADLTIGDGITVTDAAAGEFELTITAGDTGAMPIGSWVWDLEAESSGGEVTRMMRGRAVVRAEVTRGA